MPNINWTAVAVVIAATVPFINSLFQHWLKTRSESQKATANPALNQPRASTQLGIKWWSRWRVFLIGIQILAGWTALEAVNLIGSLHPINSKSVVLIGLFMLSFLSINLLPLVTRKLSSNVGAPEPQMLLRWGLLWDKTFNPHCPVDQMPLFVNRIVQAAAGKHGRHDVLKCPSCKQEFPIRTDYAGLITLTHAKQSIEADLRTGRLSD